MLIPQNTHVISTLVVVATLALMLLSTGPGWSAGAPAADAQPSRTRRSSEFDSKESPMYGDVGEPVVNQLEKRIGRLSSYGKRNDASWLDNAARKAIRSKWSNSNMAVWGKRAPPPPVDDKRSKWSGNNMAVWG